MYQGETHTGREEEADLESRHQVHLQCSHPCWTDVCALPCLAWVLCFTVETRGIVLVCFLIPRRHFCLMLTQIERVLDKRATYGQA